MGRRRLSRWQKATAVVPVALLVGAGGAAVTDTNLRTASSGDGDDFDPGVPQVPTTSFEQPASVQAPNKPPSGIDPRAGKKGTLSTLSQNGIPAAALLAYKRTETLLGRADPACHLSWTLVAAIGRVESNHGRHGGNVVGANGVSKPGIYGVPLDGSGNTARISDTDHGRLDDDRVWDRAVGPMQFIPSTWDVVAVDGDGNGKKNPQDIDDAALATGVYLCAGEGDLSTKQGAREAVMRYNHSSSYVDLVLKIAKAYAHGDSTRAPNGTRPAPVLTSREHDQTLSPAERRAARHDRRHPESSDGGDGTDAPASTSREGSTETGGSETEQDSGGVADDPGTDTGSSDSTNDTSGSDDASDNDAGDGGDGLPVGEDDGGGLADEPKKDLKDTTDNVRDTVKDTTEDPGGTVQKTVENTGETLTRPQAKIECLSRGISVLNASKLTRCITSLTE